MIRLAIYLVGVIIIAAAVWLAGAAFSAFLPLTLVAAVVLIVLGLGVIGAAYMVIERPLVVRDYAGGYPPYPGETTTKERVIEERPARREIVEERDVERRRFL